MSRQSWTFPGAADSAQSESVRVARVGDLVITSAVPGLDLTSGSRPDDAAGEFRLAFENLALLLAVAGIGPESVILLTVQVGGRADRVLIDPPWLALYPDPVRPARKTNEGPLPAGLRVQLQAIAIRGAVVQSLEIEGLKHRAPLPMGARAGSLVFSSVIGGENPESGMLVDDPVRQIDQAFENAGHLLRAGGGGGDGINHIWAYVPDATRAQPMLDAYLRVFPESDNRPARKTITRPLQAGVHLQLQITGSIDGRRGNFEVPGVAHRDPIPLASRADPLLQSSGIYGVDPRTSLLVEGGLEAEMEIAIATMAALMGEAGGTLDDIAALTVMLRDPGEAERVARRLNGLFGPAPPALRFLYYGLAGVLQIQFHVTAWLADRD